MSHLQFVMACKTELDNLGVNSAVAQGEVLKEAYIRAIMRKVAFNGGRLTEDLSNEIWTQLDKWNSVSPIPATLIHETVVQRFNQISSSLSLKGVLPCTKDWTAPVSEEVDFYQTECFCGLVDFLYRELESGHE